MYNTDPADSKTLSIKSILSTIVLPIPIKQLLPNLTKPPIEQLGAIKEFLPITVLCEITLPLQIIVLSFIMQLWLIETLSYIKTPSPILAEGETYDLELIKDGILKPCFLAKEKISVQSLLS